MEKTTEQYGKTMEQYMIGWNSVKSQDYTHRLFDAYVMRVWDVY